MKQSNIKEEDNTQNQDTKSTDINSGSETVCGGTETTRNEDQNKSQEPKKLLNSATSVICILCQQLFADRIELRQHAATSHSDSKIFFCDLCPCTFLRESALRKHSTNIHSIQPEENIINLKQPQTAGRELPFKRGRGRPPKYPSKQLTKIIPVKRSRGRPPKRRGHYSWRGRQTASSSGNHTEITDDQKKVQIRRSPRGKSSEAECAKSLRQEEEYINAAYESAGTKNEVQRKQSNNLDKDDEELDSGNDKSLSSLIAHCTSVSAIEEKTMNEAIEASDEEEQIILVVEDSEQSSKDIEMNEIEESSRQSDTIMHDDHSYGKMKENKANVNTLENDNENALSTQCNSENVNEKKVIGKAALIDISESDDVEGFSPVSTPKNLRKEVSKTGDHDQKLDLQSNSSKTDVARGKIRTEKLVIKKVSGICFPCKELIDLMKKLKVKYEGKGKKVSLVSCPFCRKCFVSLYFVENHIKNEHLRCKSKSSDPYAIKILHPESPVDYQNNEVLRFECRCCAIEFNHLKDFNDHILTVHNRSTNNAKITGSNNAGIADMDRKCQKIKKSNGRNDTCSNTKLLHVSGTNVPALTLLTNSTQSSCESSTSKTEVKTCSGSFKDNVQHMVQLNVKNDVMLFSQEKDMLQEADSTVLFSTDYPLSPEESKNNIKRKLFEDSEDDLNFAKRLKGTNEDEEIDIKIENNLSDTELEDPLNIESCDTVLNTNDNNEEEVVTSTTKEVSCNKCDKQFNTQQMLNKHLFFDHDAAIKDQLVADLTSPDHETSENISTPFGDSSAIAEKETLLKNSAIDNNTSKITRLWHCKSCKQSFTLLRDFIRHRYYRHNDDSMIHTCENCSKLLTSVTMVNIHVCTGVSTWICKKCNETFSNGMLLRQHNTERHLETIGPHICEVCKKHFLTSSMLSRHTCTSTHINLNNTSSISETSSQDDTTFSQTDENSMTLTSNSFSSLKDTTLISSANLLSKEKEECMKCILCDFTCPMQAGMRRHLISKHKSNVEVCRLCNKLYVPQKMMRHVLEEHVIIEDSSYAKRYKDALKDNLSDDVDKEIARILSLDQVVTLCQYQKFDIGMKKRYRICATCRKDCRNYRCFRIHHLKMHDTMCILCNKDFQDVDEASDHRTRMHVSNGAYLWVLKKMFAAILKSGKYGTTTEEILQKLNINDTENLTLDIEICTKPLENQENHAKKGKTIAQSRTFSTDKILARLFQSNGNIKDGQHIQIDEKIIKNENGDDDDDEDDDDDDDDTFLLLISEDDLEEHKDDIQGFVNRLCLSSDLFSKDYVINLLTNYVKTKSI